MIAENTITKALTKEYKTQWYIVLKLKQNSSGVEYNDFVSTLTNCVNSIFQNRQLSENLRRQSVDGFPKGNFSIDATEESGVAVFFDEPIDEPEEGFRSVGGFYVVNLFEETVVFSNQAFIGNSSNTNKIDMVIPENEVIINISSNKDWEYQKKIWDSIISNFNKLGFEDYTLKSFQGSFLLTALEILNKTNEFNELLAIYNQDYSAEICRNSMETKIIELDSVKYIDLDKFFTSIKAKDVVSTLKLSMCSLNELPSAVKELSNIEEIDLAYNNITEFPEILYSFKNLENLNLISNSLTVLPDNINELTSIQYLYFEDNQITGLPQSICKLKNLCELDFDDNSLTRMPDNINELENLYMLSVENNDLVSLPDTICELENLTDLYLTNNKIEKLPDNIGKLENLSTLQLGGNPISDEEKERLKRELPNCDIDYSLYEY